MSVGQISLEDLFLYDLSPVPKSMFTVTGEGRFPKNKAALKNKLKIEVSKRNSTIDVIIVDGCAALYHIHWQRLAKMQRFKILLIHLFYIHQNFFNLQQFI